MKKEIKKWEKEFLTARENFIEELKEKEISTEEMEKKKDEFKLVWAKQLQNSCKFKEEFIKRFDEFEEAIKGFSASERYDFIKFHTAYSMIKFLKEHENV